MLSEPAGAGTLTVARGGGGAPLFHWWSHSRFENFPEGQKQEQMDGAVW